MGAAALIILILFFIGLGVALYYTVLCLLARPNKRKLFSTSDRGHLLANDPDFNGNVDEEIPIDTVDSSTNNADPKLDDESMDDSTAKENEMESLLLKSVNFQVTPQCASVDSKPVFIHIEDEPSPNEADSIRHISPVNLALASKYCNASNLNEFLPRDNCCSGALSDSFEEDGLMVLRNPVNATVISEEVIDPELKTTLPSEGDSYYDFNNVKKQVNFSSSNSSERENSTTIKHENEKLPIIFSLQPSEDSDKRVPSKIIVFVEDHSPVDDSPTDCVDCSKIGDFSSNDPPYPVLPLHPYVTLHSPDELPKADDYIIINPIYAQLQKSNSDESINKEEYIVESGHLGWHAPIPDRLSNEPTYSKNISKEVESTQNEKSPVELTENSNFEVILLEHNDSNVDCKPSDENISGSSSPDLEKYNPSKDAESNTDSSSEPDVTEYSFITGPKVPSTALLLADEVSTYSDPKVTSIVTLNKSFVASPPIPLVMEQPPTPISDENSRSCSAQSDISSNTRSISDNDESGTETNNTLNQLSGTDCFTITNPNVLGTPPTTPPELKVSSGLIIDSNRQLSAPLHSTNPELFSDIIVSNVNFRGRLSSSSSVQSSSSSTSSTSTNGSYNIHAKEDVGATDALKSVTDDKSKIPRLKK